MNLQEGSFDVVEAIRHLAREVDDLKFTVAALSAGSPGHEAVPSSEKISPPARGPYLGPAISQKVHEALWNAGFDSLEKLRQASDEELLAVEGVGKGILIRIREALA